MRAPSIIPSLPGEFEQTTSCLARAPRLPSSSRSPLRYPGGKTRAVNTVMQFIPENTKSIVSPFLGGGSIELACAAKGMKVYSADAFTPLVHFWKQVIKNPVLLSERVRKYHPLSKATFYSLQRSFNDLKDPLEIAVVFYVLNRSSFSGTTLSGGMSPGHARFNKNAIGRLRDFRVRNMYVSCADYRETMNKYRDKLLYLDPPYANGESLYGSKGNMHNGFDHEDLADHLKQRDGWILSYNDNEAIRKLYGKHEILTPEWNYGMSSEKHSRELLIVNL